MRGSYDVYFLVGFEAFGVMERVILELRRCLRGGYARALGFRFHTFHLARSTCAEFVPKEDVHPLSFHHVVIESAHKKYRRAQRLFFHYCVLFFPSQISANSMVVVLDRCSLPKHENCSHKLVCFQCKRPPQKCHTSCARNRIECPFIAVKKFLQRRLHAPDLRFNVPENEKYDHDKSKHVTGLARDSP